MLSTADTLRLGEKIRVWGRELGFQQIGFSDVELTVAESRLKEWLNRNLHGSMHYMARHGSKRTRPQELQPGTVSVICARMDYLPAEQHAAKALLDHPGKAYISRYALGRDYHKVVRRRLARLAARVADEIGDFGHRVFVDSAPVMEKPLAEKAGIGWVGKHTNVINREAGSWFFLGEIYTDLALPPDTSAEDHCGTCTACLDVCPTDAIIAPYLLDARRCISYLTIELKDPIPLEFRKAIGNRIYGCDDCQLFCPWNKFARPSGEPDFAPRHGLDGAGLCELFAWSEKEWLAKTEGSAMRRVGYTRWLRNIAVALGNAATTPQVVSALESRKDCESAMVREHIDWALAEHGRC